MSVSKEILIHKSLIASRLRLPKFISKACNLCRQVLDISQFYRDARGSDGFRQRCKDCEFKQKRSPLVKLKSEARKEIKKNTPPGEKWCSCCCRYLHLSCFGYHSQKTLQNYCKECRRQNSKSSHSLAKKRAWSAAKRKEAKISGVGLFSKDYERRKQLKANFGMTLEQYSEMSERQCGRCAICFRVKNKNRSLDVDHCHETKKIRGLLCRDCNNGLGLFFDNTKIMTMAALYLSDSASFIPRRTIDSPARVSQESIACREGQKPCTSCGKALSISSFGVNKAMPDGMSVDCKSCMAIRQIETRHGLDRNDFLAMNTKQRGLCAICQSVQKYECRLYIDHCHKTMAIRGLLCVNCNHGIGKFRDCPIIVRSAIDYLAHEGSLVAA